MYTIVHNITQMYSHAQQYALLYNGLYGNSSTLQSIEKHTVSAYSSMLVLLGLLVCFE